MASRRQQVQFPVSRFHAPRLARVWPHRDRGRVGLLGGSFNPAHDGHRHISVTALTRLKLDEVWWLVSPQNPLKGAGDMASLSRRMASAREAATHPRIRVFDFEAALGTRYTADTLHALRRRYPALQFVWLMGADNLIQLPRWRHWSVIMQTVPVAVMGRPTYSLRAGLGKAAQRYARARRPASAGSGLPNARPPAWAFFPIRLHPASATAIRTGNSWQ